MKIKNLIIGAGPSGITAAQKLSERGEECLIVERRNHIGGNCYDYFDENGILIHKYGPHIFHTSYDDVREYLHQFTEFTNFQHKVLGSVDGNLIPIPFNLNSIYASFSPDLASTIEKTLLSFYDYGDKIGIADLRQKAEEQNNKYLQLIADYIFEKVFKNYTIKQRQIAPKDIDPSVLKRVPVVISKDNRYFPHHKYQGMPKEGYTKMFEKMLDSPHIKLMLNTNYEDIKNNITYDNLIYTGPIDLYFDYKYGKLDYKKTLYKLETYDQQSFQKNIVINYPNDYEYTRITEFKKFYPLSPTYNINKTVICKEIPAIGDIEAYPVQNDENQSILEKYKQDAGKLKNVHFLGRLANYEYMDMDQTFKKALDFNSHQCK